MKLVQSCCALLFAIVACSPADGEGGLTLEKKLPGSFAQLSNVVELSDGRIAFADTKAKLFLRADLQTGKVDTLGTRMDSLISNAPPEQYKFPGWVAHLAGDTLALVDFSGIRTTLWSEAGKPLGVLPIADIAGKTPVLAYDTVGNGYKVDYQAVLGGAEPGHAVRPDSVPVLRIGFKSGRVDTVANLASPEFGDAMFGEQMQQAAKVFAPNDFFGVLPNGTAWLARGHENRVDWRTQDGQWTTGTTHDYPKVPVTQADRDRVLAQVREHGKQFGMPQDLPITYPFADNKAPFDFALGRPNGEVWLQRPRAQEDAPYTYDVFNRQGRWQRSVEFPKGTSLAGFGAKGAIYGSMRTADGGRTVARFALR
jgi:hypothetical protein